MAPGGGSGNNDHMVAPTHVDEVLDQDRPTQASSSVLPGSVGPLAPALTPPGVASAAPDLKIAALMARWFPLALAAGSWGVGWALADVLVERAPILWSLVPTGLLILFRIGIEQVSGRIRPGSPATMIGFAVHTALVVVAIWLNPFVCIYAFVGYFDAERFFRGRQLWVVVGLTALLCAFGQTGGAVGVTRAPVLFACLVLVNVLVAMLMMYLSLERERQVVARERATAELSDALERNASLQQELVDKARTAGVVEERARLSREIHDTVAQGLVGVIRQLEALPDELDGPTKHHVEQAESAARDCLVEARRAVSALAPQQLRDTDLVEAVGSLAADWARTNRVVIQFDADEVGAPLNHGPVLLRVVQEGLSNVARHAAATTVQVTLRGTAEEESVRIGDDGIGFDPARSSLGHGLRGMAERLAEVGGSFQVDTRPGHGCVLTAMVPR